MTKGEVAGIGGPGLFCVQLQALGYQGVLFKSRLHSFGAKTNGENKQKHMAPSLRRQSVDRTYSCTVQKPPHFGVSEVSDIIEDSKEPF